MNIKSDSQKGGYQIVPVSQENLVLLLPLMMSCFQMKVNEDYFLWKYYSNPMGSVVGYIAIDEIGEAAGYYGVIPQEYEIMGEEKIIYQSCDTMTHPRHRRKGLFELLAKRTYAELESCDKLFVIGFSGEYSTPGFLKMGWVNPFDMTTFVYPKVFSLLESNTDTSMVHEVDDLGLLRSIICKSNIQRNIHSVKSVDNYIWRISNPIRKYRIIGYELETGSYDSFICYGEAPTTLNLFDFHFETKTAEKALLGELKKRLAGLECKGIVTFCIEKSSYTNVLRRNCFFSNFITKRNFPNTPFIMLTKNNHFNSLAKHSLWGLNAYDHDSF